MKISAIAAAMATGLLSLKSTTGQSHSPEHCAAFSELDFDLGQFDKYPEYFRGDSVVTLAEAGSYMGEVNIAEYIRFATDSSPYLISSTPFYSAETTLTGFDWMTGECEFFASVSTTMLTDPEKTSSVEFIVATMFRIFYSTQENYVKKINIYYTPSAISYIFDEVFDTKKIKNYICETMENACPDIYNLYGKMKKKECTKKLKKLPVLTDGQFSGYNQGCRILHAVFAEKNDKHCPHISFEPQVDSKGFIKCQDPAGISAGDLFDAVHFASFDDFMQNESSGVEAGTGYNIIKKGKGKKGKKGKKTKVEE